MGLIDLSEEQAKAIIKDRKLFGVGWTTLDAIYYYREKPATEVYPFPGDPVLTKSLMYDPARWRVTEDYAAEIGLPPPPEVNKHDPR